MEISKRLVSIASALVYAVLVLFLVHLLSFSVMADESIKALCLECHPQKEEMFNKAIIHRPAEDGDCVACHNPHVSRHKGLLSYSGEELCYSCHPREGWLKGTFMHRPVQEGRCFDCHDSHASDYPSLLKAGDGELCFSCHKTEDIMVGSVVHPEVESGHCMKCHTPHASANRGLLRQPRKALCVDCHGSGGSSQLECSIEVDTSGTDCIGCHSPHSSDRTALVKNSLHKPFEEKRCSECHRPGSVSVVKEGAGLCFECHKDTIESFNRIKNHLVAGKDGNPCSSCHNPHASNERYLFRDKEDRVCYQCHMDTERMVASSGHKHPRLSVCSDCHVSHGANNQFFFAKSEADTCSKEGCHPSQGRFTHPIGENVIDPRSNQPMTCNTCHNPMGARESSILRFEKDRELCIQCHQI